MRTTQRACFNIPGARDPSCPSRRRVRRGRVVNDPHQFSRPCCVKKWLSPRIQALPDQPHHLEKRGRPRGPGIRAHHGGVACQTSDHGELIWMPAPRGSRALKHIRTHPFEEELLMALVVHLSASFLWVLGRGIAEGPLSKLQADRKSRRAGLNQPPTAADRTAPPGTNGAATWPTARVASAVWDRP